MINLTKCTLYESLKQIDYQLIYIYMKKIMYVSGKGRKKDY